MKFSVNWLREWVECSADAAHLAEQLTMAGLEIDAITPVADNFERVLIGKVVAVEPHPAADKLKVCVVTMGAEVPLSIVCGGANVRVGLHVAVAVDGARVQGRVIQTAALRGVTSQGMLCSARELGLQETAEGILELSADAPLGEDLRAWLQLEDAVLDLHLTPNRGDCLSILGIAREVAALNNQAINVPPTVDTAVTSAAQLAVQVMDPVACPRYCGRIIEGINPRATSPIWLQERLRRSGLRTSHVVVDVTNYVLLELGQPLHAFDRTALTDTLIVRRAAPGETVTLLNEQTVTLDQEIVVIADAQCVHALAGIMGSAASAVQSTTESIFLESAFFKPEMIAGRARRFALNTEAAYRYERGVDPDLGRRALERATQLILEIAGGHAGPIVEVQHATELPVPQPILLRQQQVAKILGIPIATAEIESSLTRLGLKLEQEIVATATTQWSVVPPTYRFDLTQEIDLIEEIIRIKGYAALPPQQPKIAMAFLPQSEHVISLARLRHLLVDKGYHEAITYSFIAPKLQQLIEPDVATLTLLNPISTDLSVMRTTLWASLLSAASYNQNRQAARVRLFETGLRFLPRGDDLQQELMLAGLAQGNLYPESWQKSIATDFFAVKADVQALINLSGAAAEFSFKADTHPALQPGQTSAIWRGAEKVGYLGAVHPAVLLQLDLKSPVFIFEITAAALTRAKQPRYQAISKFPAIRRDISFWLDAAIPLQIIIDSVKACDNNLLKDVWVFDVYQDKATEQTRRSLALGLALQHAERTLIDDEVNQLLEKITAQLQAQFNISLRE